MTDRERPTQPSADEQAVTRFAGLAAEECGSTDARPPLVLLHGLTFDRRMWAPALRELERRDPERRAVALDLPGHGQSVELRSYRLPHVVARLHASLQEAGISRPILVGHSIAAVIATVYAAIHPTSGVVDVGQDLYAPTFALFIKAHAEELEGPGFDDVWSQVWASMDTHLLAPDAVRLLDETSRPRQEVALGYWRDLLDRPLADIDIWAASRLAAVRAAGVPYLVVAGDDPGRLQRDWLASLLPDASVIVFPKSGQFPHLAHPRRFAETLAEFADAQAAVRRE